MSQVLENIRGWGNIVFIRHDNIPFGAGVYTSMYAHVNWTYGRPSVGDSVTPNNPIAGIGKGEWTQTPPCTIPNSFQTKSNTCGYWAHLHFEIRRFDQIGLDDAYQACNGSDAGTNTCPHGQVDPNAFIAAHHGIPAYFTCNTISPANFFQSIYNAYGAPFDLFGGNATLVDARCSSSDPHTILATLGKVGDSTRVVYTKGYYYDPGISNWKQYTATCNGTLNGGWCAGNTTVTITDPDISTASAGAPVYLVGMVCSVQGGRWRCGCRDTTCTNFYWMLQGAGQ